MNKKLVDNQLNSHLFLDFIHKPIKITFLSLVNITKKNVRKEKQYRCESWYARRCSNWKNKFDD